MGIYGVALQSVLEVTPLRQHLYILRGQLEMRPSTTLEGGRISACD